MVRKILIVLGVLILLVIAAAIVLPIIFKDDIIALAKEEANKNLNAKVDFGDIGLSLFESFPDFTLSIEQVKVSGVGQFEGIDLADIETLKLSLDLMSVISGDQIEINSIGLVSPDIHVIVLPDGTANYDIAKPSEETPVEEEETTEEGGGFSVGIKEYYIRNANVIYDDREGKMYARLTNFTHEGSGDFTQDDFLLKTMTKADAVTYKMDGIAYLNECRLDMKFDMNMNMPNMKFVFDENYVRLNALHLGFDGWFAMPPQADENAEAPMDMDLTFETKETSFKSLLSLVPGAFLEGFENVKADGTLALNGMVKGRMVGEQLPAFDVKLVVNDARFQYPDLPKSAEAIAIDLHVQNPGGSEDNTIIDLNKFHVELGGNPVDMVLHMKTPISDPYIDAAINADLDLATLKDVMPLEEGQSVSGKVFSDIVLQGHQSAIDQERYEDFNAAGQLVLQGIDYKDPELPYAMTIAVCSLQFTPQHAELSAFNMNIGKSDIAMTGRVDNMVSWYVADAPLKGTFNLASNTMDLNEFMTDDEAEGEEAETAEETEEGGVAEVPAGFDFELNTAIQNMIYENITITNVKGKVVIREQKLDLQQLAMNLMDGSLTMNGYYATVNPIEPDFDFNMDITGWDIPQTFQYFETAQKIAPVMENATGRFSTNMKMAGKLDQNMEPKLNTLDGGGMLSTSNVVISSPEVLTRAADAIKYEGLKNITLNDVSVRYYFEDGRVRLDPFDFVIGKEVPANFSGSHGFDQTLDYLLKLDIPSNIMGGAASQAIGGLLAQAGQATGTALAMPERVKVDLDITGTSDDPKITPHIAGMEGGAKDALKDKAMEEINKQKEELERKAREEADKARAAAEAKAKEATDKAKAEADAARKKAEEEAKRKADEARKKAEEEKRKAEEAAKKKAEEEAKKKLKGVLK